MAELKQFVSDQLHSLLGMSESNLVDYVIALAKRSRNEPALLEALQVCSALATPLPTGRARWVPRRSHGLSGASSAGWSDAPVRFQGQPCSSLGIKAQGLVEAWLSK